MKTTQSSPVEQLETVADSVRQNLEFSPRYGIDEHPNLGNCYEFASRTQQAMQKEAGHHYVGYAFDHAFNVGTIDGSLYFLSSDIVQLSAHEADDSRVVHALDISTRESVVRGRINNVQAGVLGMAALRNSFDENALEIMRRQREWFPDCWLKAQQPNCAVMTISFARDALTNYGEFRRGIRSNDFEQMRESLEGLRVRTPQYETRPKYNTELVDFKRAIRQMARVSIVSSADLTELVALYSQTLPERNTAANIIFGDCYRHIGETMGDEGALEAAKAHYSRGQKFSRQRRRQNENELALAKYSKAEAVLKAMKAASKESMVAA